METTYTIPYSLIDRAGAIRRLFKACGWEPTEAARFIAAGERSGTWTIVAQPSGCDTPTITIQGSYEEVIQVCDWVLRPLAQSSMHLIKE